jgi:hypothetical protein
MVFTQHTGPLGGAGVLVLVLPPALWSSGAPLAAAVAVVFIYQVLFLWLPMPPALALLPTLRAVAEQREPLAAHHETGVTDRPGPPAPAAAPHRALGKAGLRWPGRARESGEGGVMPRAQIKDEKTYRELRGHGESKEKAARIANAAAASSRRQVGRKGGKSSAYEDWTKPDLLMRAREIGIKGRSAMTKVELIKALRNH